MSLGIDLYHGDPTPDPVLCMKAGISFCYFKAGEGMTADPAFADRWRAAGEVGWTRGPYFFYDTRHTPEEQAQFCLDSLTLIGTDLPWALDIETNDAGTSARTLPGLIHTWLTKVWAGCGRRPIIYTSPGFWNGAINPVSARFLGSQYELWVAHYGVPVPRLPQGWSTWTLWQKAAGEGAGAAPGILLPGTQSHVDTNVFRGDHAALVDHFRLR